MIVFLCFPAISSFAQHPKSGPLPNLRHSPGWKVPEEPVCRCVFVQHNRLEKSVSSDLLRIWWSIGAFKGHWKHMTPPHLETIRDESHGIFGNPMAQASRRWWDTWWYLHSWLFLCYFDWCFSMALALWHPMAPWPHKNPQQTVLHQVLGGTRHFVCGPRQLLPTCILWPWDSILRIPNGHASSCHHHRW